MCEIPLKDLFSNLYVLAVDRNASVADYREQVSGSTRWATGFVRDGFVDDDSLIAFFNKLNETKLGDSSIDMVRWDQIIQGYFTDRSFSWKLLDWDYSPREAHFAKSFLCKLNWKSLAPLKVSFFV